MRNVASNLVTLNKLEIIRVSTFWTFKVVQVFRIEFRVAFLAFPHVTVPVLMDFPPGTCTIEAIGTGCDGRK
jgi:hypothetical protein